MNFRTMQTFEKISDAHEKEYLCIMIITGTDLYFKNYN